MIVFIRRNWKYLVCALSVLVVFSVSFFYHEKSNNISTQTAKKLSLVKEDKKESTTLFVDVKGAVNAPGVYEVDEGKRVIDAINLAGGLSDKADTINLNLSKKLTDEMYIVVYTKEEIYNYKNSNENSKEIVCASFECECPDTHNDACIKESKADNNNKAEKTNDKVSINTASKDELMTLPGIGESKAKAIITYREENGAFKSIEDVKNVSGIGDALYEKIKDNVIL